MIIAHIFHLTLQGAAKASLFLPVLGKTSDMTYLFP